MTGLLICIIVVKFFVHIFTLVWFFGESMQENCLGRGQPSTSWFYVVSDVIIDITGLNQVAGFSVLLLLKCSERYGMGVNSTPDTISWVCCCAAINMLHTWWRLSDRKLYMSSCWMLYGPFGRVLPDGKPSWLTSPACPLFLETRNMRCNMTEEDRLPLNIKTSFSSHSDILWHGQYAAASHLLWGL